MSEVTLQVPDDLDVALNVRPDALARELSLAAAVKLFEMRKISAGKAAELAGLPKPLFLAKLAELGVSASTLSAEDIAEDIANA
jgi:predicted HTH domain antitoxin